MNEMQYRSVGKLSVAEVLHDFIEAEALPGTGIAASAFWDGLAALIADLGPRNRDLLAVRDRIQGEIDDYHRARRGQPFDAAGRAHESL